jgi:methionyl-tRNA synthetase
VYLPADVYVRFCRAKGREVLFVCGTDENAATTILEARRRATTPQELGDEGHPFQLSVFERLGISFDIFSRTSREIHHKTIWDFYETLHQRGLIFLDEVEQPFCESCEEPLPDRFIKGRCPKCGADDQYGDSCEVCAQWYDASELVDARCTLCGSRPIHKKVKHAFLRLSGLEGEVTDYVRARGGGWRKRTYRKTMSWLTGEGLIDRDITRDYDWGPTAPFLGPHQVIYNWAENLLGYISATRDWAIQTSRPGAWEGWWKGNGARLVCFLGKDNLFFHTILLPALLLGHGDYNLPDHIVVNEFVNFSSDKMSTSRGNVIWLHELLDVLDPEVIRFYAAAIAPENRDTAFSWEDLVTRANADLSDTIGNTVNRILVLAEKTFCGSAVEEPGEFGTLERQLLEKARTSRAKVEGHLESFEVKKALEEILELCRAGNRYLNEAKPWQDEAGASAAVWTSLKLLGTVAVVLYPILPGTAESIWKQIGHEDTIEECGWDEGLRRSPPKQLGDREILFRKISLDELGKGQIAGGRKI